MLLLGHIGIALGIFYLISRFTKVSIDYRYVLAGAIISDIIDKAFSLLLIGNPYTYGRLVGHTLVFLLFTILLSLKDKRFILFAGGIAIHLLLDEFWTFTGTLFWPLTEFIRYDFANNEQWISALFPVYYIAGEIIGGAILVYVIWKHRLYSRKNIRRLLEKGEIR